MSQCFDPIYKEGIIRNLTSEMLDTGSICTSVELIISVEEVSRISTAMLMRRRALKETPSPSPSAAITAFGPPMSG